MSHDFSQRQHKSYWIDSTPPTNYFHLHHTVRVDVAVIGGGIAGITTAYLLKEAGKTVVVVEADHIGNGVTGKTTAHISTAHDLIYDYLLKHIGKRGALDYAQANQSAIELIASLVTKLQIDCDFTRLSEYLYAEDNQGKEDLLNELDAVNKLDIPVRWHEKAPVPFTTTGALEYQDQAQFHPKKYLITLAKAIPGNGSYIIEETRATEITEGKPCIITTNRGKIQATDVVITTHTPFVNDGLYYGRMEPYRAYVVGLYVKDTLPKAMFDSAGEQTYYFRLTPTKKGPLVILGGESHRVGHEPDTAQCFEKLETYARNHFQVEKLVYAWSTQDNYPFDRVPFIGKLTPRSQNRYIATGFAGWGMTNGTVAGLVLTNLILKKPNPWKELFDPLRFNEKAKTLTEDMHDVKILLGDKVKRYGPLNLETLEPGQAKTGEVNGKKVAVYKDENGRLYAVSPFCTHLGCGLTWNNAEKSWDCPCHGSRFAYDGKVLHTPAVNELRKEEI